MANSFLKCWCPNEKKDDAERRGESVSVTYVLLAFGQRMDGGQLRQTVLSDRPVAQLEGLLSGVLLRLLLAVPMEYDTFSLATLDG